VREKIDAGLSGQPADVRHKILWQNSADLYRVEPPDREVRLGAVPASSMPTAMTAASSEAARPQSVR